MITHANEAITRRSTQVDSHSKFSRRFRPTLCFSMALALLSVPSLSAKTLTLQNSKIGNSPSKIGVNAGYWTDESNANLYLDYMSVNYMRLFANPIGNIESFMGSHFGKDKNGNIVDSEADMEAAMQSWNYTDHPKLSSFHSEMNQQSDSTIRQEQAQYCYDNSIDMLLMIQITYGSLPNIRDSNTTEKWKKRWELWRNYYTLAYYYADNWGFTDFQLYNEPDHDGHNSAMNQSEYKVRMRIGADAVHKAVTDADPNLYATILGPVTVAGESMYHANTSNSSARDDSKGWGELIMNDIHKTWKGDTDTSWVNFDGYAFHRYNAKGPTYINDVESIRDYIYDDTGFDLPIYVSEFNAYTASSWANRSDTADTPINAAIVAEQAMSMAKAGTEGMTLFKFHQSGSDYSNVKKNGVHWADLDSGDYLTGGTTRVAEAYRLFSKHFRNRDLKLINESSTDDKETSLLAYDSYSKMYYLLLSNRKSSSLSLTIDVSNLNDVVSGSRVMVQEVSSEYFGEVSKVTTIPSNERISITQPGDSVVLVKIPRDPSGSSYQSYTATQDAYVKAGGSKYTRYGDRDYLRVKTNSGSASGTEAAFVKFDYNGFPTSPQVNWAHLKLNAIENNTSSSGNVNIYHVYGIDDDNWTDSASTGIRWNDAPNLNNPVPPMERIEDNFVDFASGGLTYVGAFKGKPGEIRLDVTDYVKKQRGVDGVATFMIVKEIHYTQEILTSDDNIKFTSREGTNSSLRPKLIIEY